MKKLWLAAIALAILSGPAAAQTLGEEPAPPYEESLMRLSEILGAIHYLRGLCGSEDGDLWRTQMQELIEAEDTTFARRLKLSDAFNRGYDSYRAVHLGCTDAARVTIDRFLEEGGLLAAEIVARYGEDG